MSAENEEDKALSPEEVKATVQNFKWAVGSNSDQEFAVRFQGNL